MIMYGWKDPESYEIELEISQRESDKRAIREYNNGLNDAAETVRAICPDNDELVASILSLQKIYRNK